MNNLTLHALRLGLNIKINRGEITLDQAIKILKSSRKVINAKKMDKRQNNKNEGNCRL